MKLRERLFIGLQYALPHHLLSWIVYHAVRWRFRPWKNLLIRTIVRAYNVDVVEPTRQVPGDYVSFNDFFTRELKPEARPVAGGNAVACPADGTVSQIGDIDGEDIFQAKGRSYTLDELLGGRQDLAAAFHDGRFATIYLAPRNYHRVHMPLAGRLTETIYVPGRLFSVSPLTTRAVPRLFARNERLICMFDTDLGPMAVILVGAILVSSIETVWEGEIARGSRIVTVSHNADENLHFNRGDELGRFNMGSTVIVLLPKDAAQWGALGPEQAVRTGQAMGTFSPPSD